MAIVERIETYDVQTEVRGERFLVSLDEDPSFEDRDTAERAAREINEVLKRHGSQ